MDPYFARRKSIIIHSYLGALDSATRLALYSSKVSGSYESEIGSRFEQLAVGDLVQFCILARRLIEASAFDGNALDLSIHLKSIETDSFSYINSGRSISFSKMIGKVIHSHDIDVMDNMFSTALVASRDLSKAIRYAGQNSRQYHVPVIRMLNEDDEHSLFELKSFVVCADSFLAEATDHCSNQGIHLDMINDHI